jgi:hypothetical protein
MFNPKVMPVLDQVRNDRSGIQKRKKLENRWIPAIRYGRNDKYRRWDINKRLADLSQFTDVSFRSE